MIIHVQLGFKFLVGEKNDFIHFLITGSMLNLYALYWWLFWVSDTKKKLYVVEDYQRNISSRAGWFMVFNTTFNNISGISWWSVFLVEGIGVPRENHRPTCLTVYL